MYRAIKRGYAVIAIGTHLSQASFNFHCFNTTWPPEDHIEGPEVCWPHQQLSLIANLDSRGQMQAGQYLEDMVLTREQPDSIAHASIWQSEVAIPRNVDRWLQSNTSSSNILTKAHRRPVCVQLVNTMREVLTMRDWWHLPRFVYGSSRGGAMALIMAQRFPFQARSIHTCTGLALLSVQHWMCVKAQFAWPSAQSIQGRGHHLDDAALQSDTCLGAHPSEV